MNDKPPVYDLGEIGDPRPRRGPRFPSVDTQPRTSAGTRPPMRPVATLTGLEPERAAPQADAPPKPAPKATSSPSPRRERRLNGPLAATLSLFLPGAGQLASGHPKLALLFVCLLGLFASVGWAIVQTLERLNETAVLLGAPRQLSSWILVLLFALAAATHLAAVLHAHDLGEARRGPARPRPLLSTAASLLIPGWGQVLNGDRVRAVLFLGGLWHLAGAWIVVVPVLRHLLEAQTFVLGSLLLGPVLLLCATCVLWTLAVYDAASGAAIRRLQDA